jgi:asparagine N-glycosylation enzyme membrane subunit Stt3
MDKRVTKTTVIVVIIAIVIIVLAMGADMWFGVDLGVFKWVIFAVAVAVSSGVAASQATKVEKQRKSKEYDV